MDQYNDKQPRQLETDVPTYNELLDTIAEVENEEYMPFDPSAESAVLDEVLELAPTPGQPDDYATRPAASPEAGSLRKDPRDAYPAADAANMAEDGYPGVNAEAAATAFSQPLDDAMLARETDGTLPLPSYESQGLNAYPVPPADALSDNETDGHNHQNAPYSLADTPVQGAGSRLPEGNDAPFYTAPEEGGPSTDTPQNQLPGYQNYDASPDDLATPPAE